MSSIDLAFLCAILIGVLLFLYGANYYNALVGWAGFYLVVVVFFAGVVLKIYGVVRKRGKSETVES